MQKSSFWDYFDLSLISLISANIIPLFGILFFSWDIFQIVFLYWLESAVIAFYNILKLIKVGGFLSILSQVYL